MKFLGKKNNEFTYHINKFEDFHKFLREYFYSFSEVY